MVVVLDMPLAILFFNNISVGEKLLGIKDIPEDGILIWMLLRLRITMLDYNSQHPQPAPALDLFQNC